ncbi:MAG: hypothetical protein ACK4MW_00700 [Aquificaceae bacterium]
MKMLISFLLLILFMAISGMFIFLNQEKVIFILTPAFRGFYYTLPEMSIGLLVVLSFLLGFLLGYLGGIISRFIK